MSHPQQPFDSSQPPAAPQPAQQPVQQPPLQQQPYQPPQAPQKKAITAMRQGVISIITGGVSSSSWEPSSGPSASSSGSRPSCSRSRK
ncbi:hypothetical protein AB3K78_01405 [Leucobacter sp. HNU]|uniref:hypothetical protein n=1 Tax=Leucobacter sp. HNU TaxID=3236805 RepID=UPI003A812810